MLNPRKRFDCEFAEARGFALPGSFRSFAVPVTRDSDHHARRSDGSGPASNTATSAITVAPGISQPQPLRSCIAALGLRARSNYVAGPRHDGAAQGSWSTGLAGIVQATTTAKGAIGGNVGGAPDRQRAFLVRVSQTTRIRNDGPLGQSGWRMPAPNRNREGDTHVTSTQDANPA